MGQTEILDSHDLVIAAPGHIFDAGTVTLEPGCDTNGEITYICQTNPSHILIEETDPLGHNWSLTGWEWTSDYSIANAVFTCSRNETHTQTVTASLEEESIVTDNSIVALKYEKVQKPYTAAVTGPDGQSYQDTVYETLEPLKVHSASKHAAGGKTVAVEVHTDTLEAIITGDGVSESEPILIASFSENGQFNDLTFVIKPSTEPIEAADGADMLEILWIDDHGRPKDEDEEIEKDIS